MIPYLEEAHPRLKDVPFPGTFKLKGNLPQLVRSNRETMEMALVHLDWLMVLLCCFVLLCCVDLLGEV